MIKLKRYGNFLAHFRQGLKAILLMVIIGGLASTEIKAQKISTKTIEENLKVDNPDSIWISQMLYLVRKYHKSSEHQQKEEIELAKKTIDAALKIGDTLLYARALDNLGLLFRYHQWYAQAIPLHAKAFQLVKNKKVKPRYKMIFANNAGVAARYDQQYVKAVDFYLKALKLAQKYDDQRNIAISSNGLGNALLYIPGRSSDALRYFQKALAVERKRGNSLGVAMDLLSISEYYIAQSLYPQAFSTLAELMKVNQSRKDIFGIAITHESYGNAFYKQNLDLEKAEKHYEKSLSLYEQEDKSLHAANVLTSLGCVFVDKGNADKAKEFFHQSLAIADSLSGKALIIKNALNLYKLNEKQGHAAAALKWYKLAQRYKDSINLAEQKVKIAALHQEFDLEQKKIK